jgi:plasmid stability protein
VEKTKNLTLHLPADLIRRAKVYAAQNDTTINSVVRELLEQRVSREDRMRLAADRILSIADQGPLTSEDPGRISRDAIYERG